MKSCCNCRHCIRYRDIHDRIRCVCEIENMELNYVLVMTGWCRHWSVEKGETDDHTTGSKR